jgi:hypothetical protein
MVDPLLTFVKIALKIFFDLIFDQIISLSIKDMERDRRGDCNRDDTFVISGPNKKRPSDLLKALRNDSFKKNLSNFSLIFLRRQFEQLDWGQNCARNNGFVVLCFYRSRRKSHKRNRRKIIWYTRRGRYKKDFTSFKYYGSRKRCNSHV